jgi:uncharacterized protein YoxC
MTHAKDVRASVKRIRKEGERLVGRVQRDTRALLTHGRTELLKDVRSLRQDFQGRAERALHTLEKRVVKNLQGAVAGLEKRVAQLERRVKKVA